jgi:hypothetical protein
MLGCCFMRECNVILIGEGRCDDGCSQPPSMNPCDIHLHKPGSSTSAIDLAGTGLSAPNTPSPESSDSRTSLSRRRSWSRRPLQPGQDPLQLNLAQGTSAATRSAPVKYHNDSVFEDSPTEDRALRNYPYTVDAVEYTRPTFEASQAGVSTTSLIPSGAFDDREEDEIHLTRAAAGISRVDLERSFENSRRRTLRYSLPSSPLKKTGSVFWRASQNLKRISSRVANLAGNGLENQVRLEDDEDDGLKGAEGDEDQEEELARVLLLRGRTLGFLSSSSKLRLTLYKMLVSPYAFTTSISISFTDFERRWTEPAILILIIINAIILTIQAFPSFTLPSSDPSSPPRISGYFHTWVDWALFVIFCLFTYVHWLMNGFLADNP